MRPEFVKIDHEIVCKHTHPTLWLVEIAIHIFHHSGHMSHETKKNAREVTFTTGERSKQIFFHKWPAGWSNNRCYFFFLQELSAIFFFGNVLWNVTLITHLQRVSTSSVTLLARGKVSQGQSLVDRVLFGSENDCTTWRKLS